MALEILNIPYHSAINSLVVFVDHSIHTIVLLVLLSQSWYLTILITESVLPRAYRAAEGVERACN